MIINYIRILNSQQLNTKHYKGCRYEIKEIEICCEEIKNDFVNNLINMSRWNPYEYREYYLGLVNGKNTKLIKYCPHCGKPIILNKLNDEVYEGLNQNWINIWDNFHPYDFKEGERFYNCKCEE